MFRHGDGMTANTSKNFFSTEKSSKYVKSSNDIFYDCKRAKFKIFKVWEGIKSPLD